MFFSTFYQNRRGSSGAQHTRPLFSKHLKVILSNIVSVGVASKTCPGHVKLSQSAQLAQSAQWSQSAQFCFSICDLT